MTALPEQLLKSPQLPQQVKPLEELLAAEHRLRDRFYHEMTEDGKWEFINGEVIRVSPARYSHINASELLGRLLSLYVDKHRLGSVTRDTALVCLPRNDYEPDICFFGSTKAASLTRDQMKFPAPDFIVEVLSDSTERIDRGVKFEDYAANGVAEYWLVDPDKEQVEQYILRGDHYEQLAALKPGEVTSRVIKGFTIPVRAIFDRETNLASFKGL